MSAQASILIQDSQQLVISEHREWAELERLRPSWSALVAQVPSLSIFATPEWLFSWWRAYGGDQQFCVLLLTDPQAGVVGVIPVYWERRKWLAFAKLRVLRLMGDGSGDSDDLDFIVKPGYSAAVAEAFLRWMLRTSWDVCEFDCLSSKCETATLLEDRLRILGWKATSSQRPQVRVSLPDTWEQYLKQLSSKERGKVGNRLRRLESRHKVEFRRCEWPDELPVFLETLYSLHQKRWEARNEPGSFSLPARRHFYSEMTRSLLYRGWLELWQMEMDGVQVASQIALRYENCLYSLQEGFDPAYASDSVGYVLRSHVLRQGITTGVRAYDFLYGDQESKQRWGADMGHYVDIHFARPGSLGAVYLASGQVFRRGKDWLRSRTSANVWKILQALRHPSAKGLDNFETSADRVTK
jgi:CelD/BcsL family acetyltransferase involved in cellulose biosynthesis